MQIANRFSISKVIILTVTKHGNPGELASNSKKARDYAALPTSILEFYLLRMREFRPTFSL